MGPAFWTTLTVLNYAAALFVIGVILRRRKEPAAMLAWILTIILLPVLGILLFVLIGESRIQRHVRRRHRRRVSIAPSLARRAHAVKPMHAHPSRVPISRRFQDLAKIALEVGDHAPTRGNDVTLFYDAEHTFLDLGLAIEAAKSHVHLEYYIFQPDDTGRAIRDLLIRKSREGVRCRVLLDALGSWSIDKRFVSEFRRAGVSVAFFMPIRFGKRLLRVNCRNHRKLVVIDGRIGFTGSQNIGDEYLGRKRKFGPWRDTHLRVIGPATAHLQEVFAEDWHFTTGEDIAADPTLFPVIEQAGDSVIQVVASGPDRAAGAMHILVSTAVATARRSIDIITPYFVPDATMSLSLRAAALRDVRVRLLVPSRSDNWFALWAFRSYYEELLYDCV
ncbi:MAG: cardiolipin synthase [Phycisphaerae bacterium]